MRHETSAIALCALMASVIPASSSAQDEPGQGRRHFVSSSAFMLLNALPQSPNFVQLNYGYRLTDEDALIVEAITWRYFAPVGIPYGPDKVDPANEFDGYARDVGVGLAYQRFWWKGLYSTLHATPFLQLYYDRQDQYIQSGFQLFMTFRTGYHFSFWDERIFIEPSVAVTAWPINTNLPESFAAQEDRWPSYFLFEPGLHVGVDF